MDKKYVRQLFIRMMTVIIILFLFIVVLIVMYSTSTTQVRQLEQQLESVNLELVEAKK